MKVIQINSVLNSGSTGRIAEDIGNVLLANGHESYIAASKSNRPSSSEVIAIGNKFDRMMHVLKTRFFDLHGFGSKKATQKFIREVELLDPDIIHLHNIHGYYINIEFLFDYLRKTGKPVVWTFHDCWPFTGHCSYFDAVKCNKWEDSCNRCPNKKSYPQSWFFDNSKNNYSRKKNIFNSIEKLIIVTPSNWLKKHVNKSYFSGYPVNVIHNGIDLNLFKEIGKKIRIKERFKLPNKKIILGVASIWDKRKGLSDFIELDKRISELAKIVLVGLSPKQIAVLPASIIGIERTESVEDLASLYSLADVFVNPTYVDNFPTTNIESLACGTPIITYNTGGSPEAIDSETGFVVGQGDIKELYKAIMKIIAKGKGYYSLKCRMRAEKYFDKLDRFNDYLELYKSVLRK